MKKKTDYLAAALAWIIFAGALALVLWIVVCLYATFHPAQAIQPALIRVIGTPSAFRAPGDIYMRWHRCMTWCD